MIWFTIDTGSVFSALSETEAILTGIDLSMLPFEKSDSVGFGGFFRSRILNKQIELFFHGDEGEHKIAQSAMKVIGPPEDMEEKRRKELLTLFPCVLGMDILSKFDVHLYKKKFELIPRE